MICTVHHLADEIKENAIGRVCGTNGRQETCTQDFGDEK